MTESLASLYSRAVEHSMTNRETEAVELYRRLADDEAYPPALYAMAEHYRGLDSSLETHYLQAASEAGDTRADMQLGTKLYNIRNSRERAIYYFRRAASRQCTSAMMRLASMDVPEADAMYQSAVEHLDPVALYRLAFFWMSRDRDDLAVLRLQQAVHQGYAPACAELADCYLFGAGVEPNDARYMELHALAAFHGHQTSMDVIANDSAFLRSAKRFNYRALSAFANQGPLPVFIIVLVIILLHVLQNLLHL